MNIDFNETDEEVIFYINQEIRFKYVKSEKKVEGFIEFAKKNALNSILGGETNYMINYTVNEIEKISDTDCVAIVKLLLEKHNETINRVVDN